MKLKSAVLSAKGNITLVILLQMFKKPARTHRNGGDIASTHTPK